MTKDGEGECVGGIAMMLKGANANVVTQELEKRVEKIQHLLPEGVSIEPYLNRSELVNRNISTVVNNLIEGAVIVFSGTDPFSRELSRRTDSRISHPTGDALCFYHDAYIQCNRQSDESWSH